jgi:hypothetical protein
MRKPKRSDISDDMIFATIRRFHLGFAATPDVALADRFPAKVVLAKMQQLDDNGILDVGVSLRTAAIRREYIPTIVDRDAPGWVGSNRVMADAPTPRSIAVTIPADLVAYYRPRLIESSGSRRCVRWEIHEQPNGSIIIAGSRQLRLTADCS